MRNIPDFTCEYGAAFLVLEQISRTGTAYCLIREALPGCEGLLLTECRKFCTMVGAERCLALGSPDSEKTPALRILSMAAAREALPETDAALWPLLPENRAEYRRIYNEAMGSVPAARLLSMRDMEDLEGAYFVHRGETLLGIGQVQDGELRAIVSCIPGAGRDVAAALLSTSYEDRVTLRVAESNKRAIRLYEKLGFVTTGIAECWYEIE